MNFSGERAASTKRNSALKDFIKSGQTKAEVILHISNEGDEPYKPEKYGDTIIFERHIYDSKAATLFIKSTNDETVLSGSKYYIPSSYRHGQANLNSYSTL